MSELISIHPDNPQARAVAQVVSVLRDGGVVAYPTDSSYALGCRIGDKTAQERIRRIRELDAKREFTLMCKDLSELSTYAKVDNWAFRLLKALTPGPYTFILKATHEVPRRLQNPRRKTIGLRVPDNRIVNAILTELAEPIMSATLILPGESLPLGDTDEIAEQLGTQIDLIVDGGYGGLDPHHGGRIVGWPPQGHAYWPGRSDGASIAPHSSQSGGPI